MNFISQGPRPGYDSSISRLTYGGKPGTLEAGVRDVGRWAHHENFIGGAYRDVPEITERTSHTMMPLHLNEPGN